MADFIDTLQAKPEHVRRRIVVVGAFGVTCIIAFVWFFMSVATLGGESANKEKSTSPFTLIKQSALRLVGRVEYTKPGTETLNVPETVTKSFVPEEMPISDNGASPDSSITNGNQNYGSIGTP